MRIGLKNLIIFASILSLTLSLRQENRAQLTERRLLAVQQAKIPYSIQNLPETTLEKRHIQVISFPAAKPQRPSQRVLIQAAMHGNETLTISFVIWLINRFAMGESLLNKLSTANLAFDFIPVLNPDGYANGTRNNKREVNLNRNFSHYWGITRENPGTSAFSENETGALRNLFEKQKYSFAIDVHGYANWLVMPSPPPPASRQEQQAHYLDLKKNLQQAQKHLPGHELKTPMQLGDGGAFEDWAFWEQGVQAFCLEMANSERYLKNSQPGKNASIDSFLSYERFIYEYLRAGSQQTIVVHN